MLELLIVYFFAMLSTSLDTGLALRSLYGFCLDGYALFRCVGNKEVYYNQGSRQKPTQGSLRCMQAV